MYTSVSFKALGSDNQIVIGTPSSAMTDQIIKKVIATIEHFEARFSRFDTNNELFKFNKESSGQFVASQEFINLLTRSIYFYKTTAGIFNPAIIQVLENYYPQSFDQHQKNITKDSQKQVTTKLKFSEISIQRNIIINPHHLQIDFGGIGKGYIADICAEIIHVQFSNFWISLGGDLFISGKLENSPWSIGIQNPLDLSQDLATFKPKSENIAVATSGISKRHGVVDGKKWHHIIDPRTSQPVNNNLMSVTVIAPTVTEADIYAKTVLILGKKDGLKFISRKHGTACIIIDKKLTITSSSNIDEFGEILL